VGHLTIPLRGLTDTEPTAIEIPGGPVTLGGDLTMPVEATGVVVFAHGSGSSRHSPRNQAVAGYLVERGFATLLLDLLTPNEEFEDKRTRALRFDIPLLARRVGFAVEHVARQGETAGRPIALFGASTGASAALVAAAECPDDVAAVVSRGGRPDLAGDALERVRAATLLIVGGEDDEVRRLNQQALERLACTTELKVIPGATHLFEEPGALEEVARLAGDWFDRHLAR